MLLFLILEKKNEQMGRHEKADHNFYITANLVMNLATRAKEIFNSSEVDEKRQLLNLMFQNLQLKDVSLSFQVREPFATMMDFKNRSKEWGRLDSNQRTPKRRDLQSLAIAAMRHPLWSKKYAGERNRTLNRPITSRVLYR